MAKNKKLIATVAAVATSAALLLGGTLAWQSANQTALNEASDVINPGGRLHDDFDGTNKDVYVENFAEDPIFARVRLEEYFEIITNYTEDGAAPEKVHPIVGEKVVPEDGADLTGKNVRYKADGTTPLYVREYETHIFTEDALNDAAVGTVNEETDETQAWWNWQLGGSTVYMPTFNLNKDSLLADVNGIYEEGNVGTISNRFDPDDPQYTEYTDYAELGVGHKETANELYDGDANDIDEFTAGGYGNVELADIIANGENSAYYTNYESSIELVADQEHTAKPTGDATLISMADWDGTPGPYWVYDTDGWVYWAQAIEPDSATGLLLDGIELNQVMDDTWYYAINVIAQFVTADDVGKSDGTGFYDETDDYPNPSADAEELLKTIGVFSVDEKGGEDDGEEDDEDEWSERSIHYNGRNGTIYVSDPAIFATGGSGVSFTLYDHETGFDANADYASWGAVTARDSNTYASTEDSEGHLLVTVNKTANDINNGDEFMFTVSGTHMEYGDALSVDITVIIGEEPVPVVTAIYPSISTGGDIAFFYQSTNENAIERKYYVQIDADYDNGDYDTLANDIATWTFYKDGEETNKVEAGNDMNDSYIRAYEPGTYTYDISIPDSEVTASGSITFVESAARINNVTLKNSSGWRDISGIKAYMYGKSIGAEDDNYIIESDFSNNSSGEYTLTLTPGVEFADGTKIDVLNETDVTYSIDWNKNSKYREHTTDPDHKYEWHDYAYDKDGLYYTEFNSPNNFITFGKGSIDYQNPSINDLTVCPFYCIYDGSEYLGGVTFDISVVYEDSTHTGEFVVGMPYIEFE